jgi:DNA-binding CsgD family transcriptional regulator
MVVGEPGIGKTSVCEQLATYVAMRGGRVLVGHCYEEGSLSLPYLPFIEALQGYVLTRELDDLREELGNGAPEVARIIPEIRDRLQVELRPAGDPEENRWRLLQAVSSFLRNASSVLPVLIVLEDLHDADRGTLDLLLHLARNLAGARLLIVGTYRDLEVNRAHPLARALAGLQRAGNLLRVPLRGLTVDEVQRMMSIVRGQEVPRSRAEAIHHQTEGNPLFVQEVLRYLVDEGIIVREGGRYVLTEAGAEASIPEGLRDVIGRGLNRLGERTNQVLSVAAVIGREFRLDVLQRVAGMPEEELYAALEEATGRAVVEQRQTVGAVSFRFSHAFFRQTLYEEIFVPRRIRLHQQVGRAIEEVYERRLEEHAAELAEHYGQSTESADLEKALRYSELAAQRAMQVFAYGEAVRHLEQAIRTQEALDPENRGKRCDLLLALAEAMLPLEEPSRVTWSVAPEAFALAESIPDAARAGRAAVLACEGNHRSLAGGAFGSTPELRAAFLQWTVRAEQHTAPGSPDRVRAEVYRGVAEIGFARPVAGHVHLRRAVDLALELGDDTLVFFVAGWAFSRMRALRDLGTAERLAHEVLTRPRHLVRASDLGMALLGAGRVLLRRGDRDGAEIVWQQLAQHAEHTHDASLSVLAMGCPMYSAYLDGRLEEGLAVLDATEARAQELDVMVDLHASVLHFYLGQGSEELLNHYELPARVYQAYRSVLLAYLGRHEEVRQIRDSFGDIGSDEDETGTHFLLGLFEAAILGADRETVAALLPRLAPLADWLHLGIGSEFGGSVGRYLGDACALLGRPDEARAYYERALAVCHMVRFRPETAITRLHLAELLLNAALTPALSQREREQWQDEALAHLEFAVAEFREMKMQPFLERALALQAAPAQPARAQPDYPDGLSEREVEVLRLIAAGKSNRDIADALIISLNTVYRHVTNIFAKIGAANRTEAAAYAMRHGLVE